MRTAGVPSEGPLGSFQALDLPCPSKVKVGAPLYLSRALGGGLLWSLLVHSGCKKMAGGDGCVTKELGKDRQRAMG